MPRFLPALSILLALAATAGPALAAAAATPDGAKAVVQSFDDSLLAVMKNAKTLGFQGRYDKMAPVIDRDFDIPFTTKLVIGSGWNDIPADKQAALIDRFRTFTISTYANRFDGYGGEQIGITGTPLAQRDDVRVQTEIVLTGGQPPVKLDYILHSDDKGWQIIDIFLQGTISQLATQRSEFQAVLKSAGVDGLIAMLDKKTADLATPPSAAK